MVPPIHLVLQIQNDASNLPHRDSDKLHALLLRAKMIIARVFPTKEHYLQELEKISFNPMILSGVSEVAYDQAWKSGKGRLTELCKVMLEDLQMSEFEDLQRKAEASARTAVSGDESRQLRHSARCVWRDCKGGHKIRSSDVFQSLNRLGYNGQSSLDADTIIEAWKSNSWVEFSPSGHELRLTPAGFEQLQKWEEEDRLWNSGSNNPMPLNKRLIAGQPATNLRKIKDVIGTSSVTGVHDPYTTAETLETLLRLADIATLLSPSLRFLRPPFDPKKATEQASLIGFLKNINAERNSAWAIRTYTGTTKPHRRFLVLDDGSVVTCGMSLNYINKDEVLDREPAGSEYAKHDCEFFENNWKKGAPL